MDETASYIIFTYNGNATGDDPTFAAFRIEDVTKEQLLTVFANMEELNYSVNGCIEQPHDQFSWNADTIGRKYLVTDGGAYWAYLHEVPMWKME